MNIKELYFSVSDQLKILKDNKRYAHIVEAASIANGIRKLNSVEQNGLLNDFENFKGEVIKFVPASGAASRMFKHIYDLDKADNPLVIEFLSNITSFPFFEKLKQKTEELKGVSPQELVSSGRLSELSELILSHSGLNYSQFPKGLIPFYKSDQVYNPFQIHVNESAFYARKNGRSAIHFTISPSHKERVKSLLDNYIKTLTDTSFQIEYSEQLPETDTIALNSSMEIVKNNNTELLRPGGHGALIYNLNQIESDIIFIKNIDNVVVGESMKIHSHWKKVLGGVLLEIQNEIFDFQKKLDMGSSLKQAKEYLKEKFGYTEIADSEVKNILFRPIRVCGMVKNEGQPGGGPFFVTNPDTGKALQIVESAELDGSNSGHQNALQKSTHFNPVDLVCGVKDYEGNKLNLLDFVDKKACFTSMKNFEGEEIKILELPGLWNGAMANWNSIFIEVPAETFNPVKTVNDLLKESFLK